MPIRIFDEFSQLKDVDEFRRFLSAWAKQIQSEINNVISPNVKNTQTSISSINSDLATINSTLTAGLSSYNGHNVIVSSVNASNNLSIVRGTINPAGLIILGEGFTVSASSNIYTITFTTPFFEAPIVVATAVGLGSHVVTANIAPTTTTLEMKTYDPAGANQVNAFSFIAMGIMA